MFNYQRNQKLFGNFIALYFVGIRSVFDFKYIILVEMISIVCSYIIVIQGNNIVISTNKKALSDKFYNSSEDLMAKARSISAKQLSHIKPILTQSHNQKDINTLINTAVQSVLLNKDKTQNILNTLSKDWAKLAGNN